MKRVISLLLALTVALSLAACGGSASSSAASSEAASESASSEPEATAAPTETPAPAVSNYFAEHGVEVLPSLPEDAPKVYYCTWQKDNPDVYAQWDDADISFNQTVEPSDEKEGYKKVTLETEDRHGVSHGRCSVRSGHLRLPPDLHVPGSGSV